MGKIYARLTTLNEAERKKKVSSSHGSGDEWERVERQMLTPSDKRRKKSFQTVTRSLGGSVEERIIEKRKKKKISNL